jgi:hypothetical protein
MEFFLIEVDSNYIAPCPKNCNILLWRNVESIEKFVRLPKHIILRIENHMQMVYTDLIMYPNFCVTEKVKEAMELFQPGVYFKRIILYNKERKKSMPYYMPLLETVDCFTENTIYNADRSVIHRAQIDSEMIGGRIFFRAGGVKCNCILGRLDFVESLLKRNVLGLGLKEVLMK